MHHSDLTRTRQIKAIMRAWAIAKVMANPALPAKQIHQMMRSRWGAGLDAGSLGYLVGQVRVIVSGGTSRPPREPKSPARKVYQLSSIERELVTSREYLQEMLYSPSTLVSEYGQIVGWVSGRQYRKREAEQGELVCCDWHEAGVLAQDEDCFDVEPPISIEKKAAEPPEEPSEELGESIPLERVPEAVREAVAVVLDWQRKRSVRWVTLDRSGDVTFSNSPSSTDGSPSFRVLPC